MPSPVLNSNWLNQNLLRNFPFIDDASRLSSSGDELPNGLIADISLPVPIGIVNPGDVFVHKVVGFSTGVAISLADRNSPATTIASTTIFTSGHSQLESYTLGGQGVLTGITGRITIGDPKTLLAVSKTVFNFESVPNNTRLVISAIRPYIQGVAGISIEDTASGSTTLLTGVVSVEPGDNMSIDVSSGSIVLNSSLVQPEDAEDDCGCEDSLGASGTTGTGSPIMTVNGIEPDENGNFTIEGVDCTEIQQVTNGLEIIDTCSTPCCECDQLDVLYQALQAVENEVARLQEVEEQLRGRIDNMQTTLLNASLNPPGGADEAGGEGIDAVWFLPIGPGGYGGIWVGG